MASLVPKEKHTREQGQGLEIEDRRNRGRRLDLPMSKFRKTHLSDFSQVNPVVKTLCSSTAEGLNLIPLSQVNMYPQNVQPNICQIETFPFNEILLKCAMTVKIQVWQ